MAKRDHSGTGAAVTADAGSGGASVIGNALQVLRCFTTEQPLVGVTEIATQVGLHKSSVSRIMATLESEGVVQRDRETRKFRLGVGLMAIAAPLIANLDVRQVAHPFLEQLESVTEETVVLAIWDGEVAISVEQIPSRKPIKHTSELGSRYHDALDSTVQMFLAYETPERIAELAAAELIRFPPSLTLETYGARLAAARAEGCAVNYGETSADEVGVAAPVCNHLDQIVGVVMIAIPYYRVPTERLAELKLACVATARQVSQRLGAQR